MLGRRPRRVAHVSANCKAPVRSSLTAGDKLPFLVHNAPPVIPFQESAAPDSSTGLIAALQNLGWIDKTALGVLLVFCVMGLFKGLVWQVSRIGILIAAYLVSGQFGHDVAELLHRTGGQTAADPGPADTTIYLAYCLLFVAVLVVLSLLAMAVKKLVDKAGLGFFDRVGGGVLGVATGACVVLAMVFAINMFFPQSELARAAERSHSQRFSRRAIEWLGTAVDDDLRGVLALHPLRADAPDETTPGTFPGQPPAPGDPLDPDYRPRMPDPLPLPPDLEPGEGQPGGGIR